MYRISKILIANRGEIALRIIRACKELEIKSVVVFSQEDVDGIWVRKADEAYPLIGNPIEVYLNYKKIINIAKKANCDAIHPGYGFLSESAEFAQMCEDRGVKFIGPKAKHIELFGDKIASKVAMKEVGVPIVEGTTEPITDKDYAKEFSTQIGFPVIIKAAFGGGGRGMRIVHREEDFIDMFESAKNESLKYFGKSDMFVEKYVQNPRHIEVQILADSYGNVIHLGERDCSIQRRHQKVIEISPSPLLNENVRQKIYDVSVNAMKQLGYESVGTVEFLVDEYDEIFFIEMNTRVQVEHPVTEMVTGIDIIYNMIDVASGKQLELKQDDVKIRGYAIEFRINSEDPSNNFFPSIGKVENLIMPSGPGVRIDTSLYKGYELPHCYDSMLGKLIVQSHDWKSTVEKARCALDEFYIEGFVTNILLHKEIVRNYSFKKGQFDTGYLDNNLINFTFKDKNIFKIEEEKSLKLASMIEKQQANSFVKLKNYFTPW